VTRKVGLWFEIQNGRRPQSTGGFDRITKRTGTATHVVHFFFFLFSHCDPPLAELLGAEVWDAP